MRKRIMTGMLAALFLLLGGMFAFAEETMDTPQERTPVTPFLEVADYPVMDGSTACLPLMARIMSDATGISLEDAQAVSFASKTSAAYEALLGGSADILLVYEASEEIKQRMAQSDEEIECTPIGTDALVFIANEANMVDSITQEQLIDIYTGKITNWKDVGGADMEIRAFQRNETSGSQTLFLKLLMEDAQPMKAPTESVVETMSGLLDTLSKYNNEGNALGFSVFYYASEMYAVDGLKMLAVDGVHPSAETLASGEYPLLNQFYVVTRKDLPENDPARLLREYILSENGENAIQESGYIALQKQE